MFKQDRTVVITMEQQKKICVRYPFPPAVKELELLPSSRFSERDVPLMSKVDDLKSGKVHPDAPLKTSRSSLTGKNK